MYYHRDRTGSISHLQSSKADAYLAQMQKCRELALFGYPDSKIKAQLQVASLNYCGQASCTEDLLYQSAIDTVENIDGIPKDFNKRQRLKLILCRVNRKVYRTIYRLVSQRMQMDAENK